MTQFADVELRRFFRRVEVRGVDAPLASATTRGVELRSELAYEVWNPLSGTEGYKLVEAGDFVVGLRAFQHGLSFSEIRGLVSPAYTVFRTIAQDRIHDRFYRHYFRSDQFISGLDSMGQGIRQGKVIDWKDLAGWRIPVPTMWEQRRIADFLDDQVACIDRAVSLRLAQETLWQQRRWLSFSEELQAVKTHATALRRLLTFLADGPFGSAFTSNDYREEGHPVVRLGNIGFAEFKGSELARVPNSVYSRFPRCHIRPGDMLIASLGDDRNHAGRACIAPPTLDGGMVKGKCFIARIDASRASAPFLAALLSSPLGAETITQAGRGSTRQMINMEILKEARLPLPSIADQTRVNARFREASAVGDRAIRLNRRALELLEEHKRALITAAVTGEFDASTAGSRAAAAVTG